MRPFSAAPLRSQRNPLGTVTKATKAVIFDMDGVLCASEGLSREAAALVFKQLHQLEVAPEEFIPFGGQGEERFLGGVAAKYSVAGYQPEAAKQQFFANYLASIAGPNVQIVYPGAVELVRACRAAGLKTAVGSSAEQVKVDANLAAAGFAAADFDAVVAADDFEAIKPAPDIFLAAARMMGVAAADCVVVEDAPAGIQAAKAAGMRVIGVTTMLSAEELAQHSPDLTRGEITNITVTDITNWGTQ